VNRRWNIIKEKEKRYKNDLPFVPEKWPTKEEFQRTFDEAPSLAEIQKQARKESHLFELYLGETRINI